jgi:hypothetical protein
MIDLRPIEPGVRERPLWPFSTLAFASFGAATRRRLARGTTLWRISSTRPHTTPSAAARFLSWPTRVA